MEIRRFGRTGAKVSILTLGGCGVGYEEQEAADKAIQLAIDNGINIIDVAPTYGKAEERLSKWVQKYRKKFFLSEKTLKRTAKSAMRQLERSLKKLGTDYFDLYQFHAVANMEDLDKIFAENGAMEAFEEAKETGMIRHIGITGHEDMRVLKKALEISDEFDTILLPISLASILNPNPVNDFRPILEVAQKKNIGITAIKAISKGRWQSEPSYNTWYEPLTNTKLIEKAITFTLSQEGVTTYSIPCDIRLWSMVIDAANSFKKKNPLELNEILTSIKSFDLKPLYPES